MALFPPLCVAEILPDTGVFGASYLALLNSGFGALIGKKMAHNKFPKPNSYSF